MSFLSKVKKINQVTATALTNKEVVFDILDSLEEYEAIGEEIKFQANQAKRDPDEQAEVLHNSLEANLLRVERWAERLRKKVFLI